jgi:hypothetical protein
MKCTWLPLNTCGLRLAILVGGFLFLIAPMRAQEEGFLKADKLDGKEESKFRGLYEGKFSVKGNSAQEEKEHKAILDKAARWYANRLTHPAYQENTEKGKTMNGLVDEVSKMIRIPDPKRPLSPEQAEFAKEFGTALIVHLRKVLKNDKPITRVNAARILALLNKAEQEEAADALVDVLKDPNESDGVKLYAARGLKDLFMAKQPAKDRELRCVTALINFLDKLSKAPASQLPADEEQGVRYVRREVIRALAQSRYPSLGPVGKEISPAWWLLRVARRNGIEPEPNVMEQVEAAIGLCQLQPKLTKDYNAEYVAYQVGEFIVDFAGYSINPNQLPPSNYGVGIAWKIQAARLSVALDRLRDNVANKAVGEMIAQAKVVLSQIEIGKLADASKLEGVLKDKAPKGVPIIKSQPNTVLK